MPTELEGTDGSGAGSVGGIQFGRRHCPNVRGWGDFSVQDQVVVPGLRAQLADEWFVTSHLSSKEHMRKYKLRLVLKYFMDDM